MRTLVAVRHTSLVSPVVLLAAVLTLAGCSSAKEQPAELPAASSETAAPVQPNAESPKKSETKPEPGDKTKGPGENVVDEEEMADEKPRDLGDPLVDGVDGLHRLDEKQPVWIDSQKKQVVLLGEVCRAGYPLEFFATYGSKSYESVVSVNVTPWIVHTGLLAVGAEPGHPVQFTPDFVPPTGTEVAIDVRWKDGHGVVQTANARDWIRNIKTGKALDVNWIFGGSQIVTDESTGKKYYLADSGDLICVLSLPSAMLDLPIRGYGALESRQFEAFEEKLPPPGTPVTIILKPILNPKPPAPKEPAAAATPPTDKQTEADRQAIAAAEAWLALVDQAEYSQSWETAAEQLRSRTGRREFIQELNASRKPLGAVKSRKVQSKEHLTKAGQYIVLRYATSFAEKQWATETVTLVLDKDDKCRVSGYSIL